MSETFLNGKVTLWAGDCLDVLARLEECSIDSVVCDPPYHLTSIVKRFGGENAAPAKPMKSGDKAFSRLSGGFMGKQWDGGDIAFRPETWAAVYRVLKPGGYLLAFSGTRTYHRMACAIEDAGFDVRDMVSWVFGSGFPKSHDVSKAIDKASGAERTKVRVDASDVRNPKATGAGRDGMEGATRPWIEEAMKRGYHEKDGDEPITDSAREWSGWGTALKPALEPICMARKPLSEGTVAANVLAHGTGAINIDGCRVATSDVIEPVYGGRKGEKHGSKYGHSDDYLSNVSPFGRWPANVIHDGSEEVTAAFPETGAGAFPAARGAGGIGNNGHKGQSDLVAAVTDAGSAARFFYSAKADADDRLGSSHPTVKPVDLMQYLVRLVTPKGGTVLDPFSGTGTTGEAAWREGMHAILIEREAEYQADIRRRMALCLAGPDERARESIKAKMKDKPIDAGPLFENLVSQ